MSVLLRLQYLNLVAAIPEKDAQRPKYHAREKLRGASILGLVAQELQDATRRRGVMHDSYLVVHPTC